MELLNKICSLYGISGFEYMGISSLAEIFSEYLAEVSTDKFGNLTGYLRCGKADAPLILLEAHFDVIGLMVKDIHEEGLVSVISIGGVDPRILPGSEVLIHGKNDVYGVIGIKPPHVLTKEEMKTGISLETITIDTGYETENLKNLIDVGSPISIKTEHFKLGEDKFCGAGLDDRAGIYALLQAVNSLKDENIDADICVLASTCEETGRYGAKVGAYSANPNLAIVVDVTHGDTPDGIEGRTNNLNSGPAICKGPNLDRQFTNHLIKVLNENNVKFQVEVEDGDTGTNAWVIQTVNEGIPCVLISIPLRYMHTNIETLSIPDLKNTSYAINLFIKSLKGDLHQC